MSTDDVKDERWAALESNPEVLTKFCHLMGVGDDWEVFVELTGWINYNSSFCCTGC
jgi:hypothetical protein